MIDDAKLNSLDTRLEQFKFSNSNTQQELQTLIEEYSQLLEGYKTLKHYRAVEQLQRNGVSSASTPVNEQDREKYVLVLVDGNGYVFNDELIKDKEEGGMRAARMLNDGVESFLKGHPQMKESRIAVRIYADVTSLSKQIAKTGLLGFEKRSLMPFVAGFSRALGSFDFVDALDEEGTRFKIRETFKLAAEDATCHHILFAGCHDISYVSQLDQYTSLQNKVTLVQGAGFQKDFYRLGMTIAQFPTIFRWSELATAPHITKESATRGSSSNKASHPTREAPKISALDRVDWREKPVRAEYDGNGLTDGVPDLISDVSSKTSNKKTKPCKYFQKGFCRWGDKCGFLHVPDHVVATPLSSTMTTNSGIDRQNISAYLPSSIPPGCIALNKDNHRLDAYVRPPTSDEWNTYTSRFRQQKPCNSHHLSGTCHNIECPFDHHPLEVETQHCLEYVVKSSPCPRRGACRDKDCYHGHVCQKDGCMGQVKGCRLKVDAHEADLNLATMVPAAANEAAPASLVGNFVGLLIDPAYGQSW